jgi:hypothetical protein
MNNPLMKNGCSPKPPILPKWQILWLCPQSRLWAGICGKRADFVGMRVHACRFVGLTVGSPLHQTNVVLAMLSNRWDYEKFVRRSPSPASGGYCRGRAFALTTNGIYYLV